MKVNLGANGILTYIVKKKEESDEQKKLVDYLKAINDLIKDKIWINKNY